MQLTSPITYALPQYQKVAIGSALTKLSDEILATVETHQPIMAKHIASLLSVKHKITLHRREINSRLFKFLFNHLTQDEYFRWSLRNTGARNPGPQKDPEEAHYELGWDVVNLDSTVRIKYLNGKELTIEFTKTNRLTFKRPKAGITYEYSKSPLALALLTKKVGDICDLPDGQCEVVEID